jgi:hypothetical protein
MVEEGGESRDRIVLALDLNRDEGGMSLYGEWVYGRRVPFTSTMHRGFGFASH